ncbi:MAG TPA: hypothetical protein VKT80_17530, partial [Chloroflexota bacterium]|nr:hypothetical protein [Chloroflexota bacterium]
EKLIRYFARTVGIADEDLEPVVRMTDGATPATLKEIVKRATVGAVGRMDGQLGKIHLKQSDLMLAVKQVESMRETPHARVTGFAG